MEYVCAFISYFLFTYLPAFVYPIEIEVAHILFANRLAVLLSLSLKSANLSKWGFPLSVFCEWKAARFAGDKVLE